MESVLYAVLGVVAMFAAAVALGRAMSDKDVPLPEPLTRAGLEATRRDIYREQA